MYEWWTIDGRFEAGREVRRLEHLGKEKEAKELLETLEEAMLIYEEPNYCALMDRANKQILLLYSCRTDWVESAFDKFIRTHLDNYICHVTAGSTWLMGMVCQQCEPLITSTNIERWRVFETENEELWFEKM